MRAEDGMKADVETAGDWPVRGWRLPRESGLPACVCVCVYVCVCVCARSRGSDLSQRKPPPGDGWSSRQTQSGRGLAGHIPAELAACAKAQNVYTLVRLFI